MNYYPSCRAQLLLRADDYRSATLSEKKLKVDPNAVKIITEPRACQHPDGSRPRPNDPFSAHGALIPRSATVSLNGFRKADTAELTLDFADAPIDPRVLSAANVDIFLGTIPPDEYPRKRLVDGTFENLVFRGLVDEWKPRFDDSGEEITISCRDYTAIFHDVEIPAGITQVVSLKQPVWNVIRDIMSTLPMARGMCLELRPIADFLEDFHNVSESMPTGNLLEDDKTGHKAKRAKRMSYWDYMLTLAMSQGFILFFELDHVVIQRARTLYAEDAPLRKEFSRTYQGETFNIRRMIWGHNLEELEFSRKMSGLTVPTITVTSYDTHLGKPLTVRWPLKPRATLESPSGKVQGEDIRSYVVDAVAREDVLLEIAKGIYEQIARQELEGSMKTRNLASFGGNNENPDLLKMRAGDPVEIGILPTDRSGGGEAQGKSIIMDMAAQSPAEITQRMIALGFDRRVAAKLALNFKSGQFPTVFRAQEVQYDWDVDSGVSIDIRFINYIEILRDPELSDFPAISAGAA